MRAMALVYGLSASFGTFAVTAWMTVAIFSDGALPGSGGAAVSVTVPLAIACAIMAAHCLLSLMREGRR